MTVEELVKKSSRFLREKGIEEGDYDALCIVRHVFNWDMTNYLCEKQSTIENEAIEQVEALVKKRGERIPLQQIFSEAPFYGYSFYVNDQVLIPRFDTEILVSLVLERHKERNLSLLDLCTGSGCIGITLKLEGNYEHVLLSDISEGALSVAKKNRKLLKADVDILESDLFSKMNERFDVIVSNPPYIKSRDMEMLEPEVKEHDPFIALWGGEDGLDFYRRITKEAVTYLNPRGSLYFEIGFDEAEEVQALLLQNGFENVTCVKDFAGKDRVVYGQLA